MNVTHNLSARRACPFKDGFKVIDGKVQILVEVGAPALAKIITVSNGIVAGENGATAVEVVAATRNTVSLAAENVSVELRSTFNIGNWQNDTIQSYFGTTQFGTPPRLLLSLWFNFLEES
jgi:hypothetical protein